MFIKSRHEGRKKANWLWEKTVTTHIAVTDEMRPPGKSHAAILSPGVVVFGGDYIMGAEPQDETIVFINDAPEARTM